MSLIAFVTTTADYLAKSKIYPSMEADTWLTAALKTVNYYERAMWQAVKDLYNGQMDVNSFEDVMIGLIENQLRRAWNEGMRDGGLDPAKDMTPDMESMLQEIMLSELSYVDPLAQAIVQAAKDGTGYEQFRSRVSLWANRYNDVVSRARAEATKGNLMWQLGTTEKHCPECIALNGLVASLDQWKTAGFKPQSDWNGNLPNEYLTCKGFRCDCALVPTTKRRSPKVLDTLLNIRLLKS